jgi:hypothetical protein
VERPLLEAYARQRGIKLAAVDVPGMAREVLRADGIAADNPAWSDCYVVARAVMAARLHFKADALADKAHPFTWCMENIAPTAKVDDPEAFCANLVHEATGQWPAEYSRR